jgi:BMFP domain-containing protein YqiC
MYPLELKLFPRDEDWATGDEYLDKKLNSILVNCFSDLSLRSIEDFYNESMQIKTRVMNPSFYYELELCTKALIGLFDGRLYVDQEILKIKGKKSQFKLIHQTIELDLSELIRNKHQRLFSNLDIFQREQSDFEQNPFVPFKLKKRNKFFELKIVFKDLIERLNRADNQKFEHELFELLSKKYIVEIRDIGYVWYHQGTIYCVNN